jgi:DNA-binding PadR family transcriptional regulator
LLLHQTPAHGYTLVEQMAELGLGDLNPSGVYRMLRDMEERGWVTSSWDEEESQGPPRRVYQLTPLGDEVLRWWAEDMESTRVVIDRLLEAYAQHVSAEGEHDHG